MLRTSLVALAFAALVPQPAGAKCARTEMVPVVLTTRDTKLPDDGGVLVGWSNEVYKGGDGDARDRDPSDQPTWTATTGSAAVALTRTSLAPGLSVYKPAKGTGKVILKSKTATLGTFTHDAKAAASSMAAPGVKELVLSVDENERWRDRHAKIKLDKAPPEAAMALITYRVDAKDNTPLTFVRIADTHDKLLALDAFEDHGHCGGLAPNSQPPSGGDKVVFAWVDAFGRLSPVSAPITAK